MPVKCQLIMDLMEQLAPRDQAEDWDNVGLLVGSPGEEVRHILITLDVNPEVVREAISLDANLIICHHPPIFKPLKTLRWDSHPGTLLRQIIQHDLMVFCAHTNLDSADQGVNHHLACLLDLQEREVLAPGPDETWYKVVVFVPLGHEDQVREAMAQAGAGWLGNYSHCTFQTAGTGTFKPLAGSNPFIGQEGHLERVEEMRLETIVPEGHLRRCLAAMVRSHPYEEVAYDVYPLKLDRQNRGLGRIGQLREAVPLSNFLYLVKTLLNPHELRLSGNPKDMVQRVAVAGGAGANLIKQAVQKGADVLVTGDVKYHQAQEARELGLAVIDAGHYATERVILPALQSFLNRALMERLEESKVFLSEANTDPWQINGDSPF